METDFRKRLKDPLFLNIVSGVFALERAYETLTSQYLKSPGFGHLLVVSLFMAGAAAGYFGKDKFSYILLIIGSILLLVVLAGDICAVNEYSEVLDTGVFTTRICPLFKLCSD